jgi:RNA polymerase sigma factor (sigma-70 family)
MKTDSELLSLYAEARIEGAFADLVGRHLRMVYSCALHRVGGDKHLAEDVTQIVFNDLARKARRLTNRPTLSGWLYVSTQKASAGIVRKEQRRKSRELQACTMQEAPVPSGDSRGIDWVLVRPLLDDLILDLNARDRDAVVLRFFEQRQFAEIGAALQTSEEAVRKRVGRAVEKLRTQLERRGLTSTTDALEFALAEQLDVQGPKEPPAARVAFIAATEFTATGVATSFFLSLIRILTSPGAFAGSASLAIFLIMSHQIRTNSELKAELAHLGRTADSVRELKNENRRLESGIEQDADLARKQSIAHDGSTKPVSPGGAKLPAPLNLVVTAEGTISWEEKHVTLSEFLEKLVAFQAQHPGPDAQVIVHGEAGAAFSSTAYVVEQASKAGIQNILVDSQSKPTASDAWTFSPQVQTTTEHGSLPPSLPDPATRP